MSHRPKLTFELVDVLLEIISEEERGGHGGRGRA